MRILRIADDLVYLTDERSVQILCYVWNSGRTNGVGLLTVLRYHILRVRHSIVVVVGFH